MEQVDKNETKDRLTRTTESLNPLISVVVPIYNVEKYIRKCLDSLKGQSLKEIEVICIDDGSTDGSGRIADEYASDKFPIFRVIHTENKGLSAARNRAIDESRADWLMLVDSDDWVEPDFCKVSYEVAIENQADMVIFNYHRTTQRGRVKRSKVNISQTGNIDQETAYDIGGSSAWNRLYKKTLFLNTRFPEGHVYEEVATTHKLIYCATQIMKIPNYLYYYRYRRNSITNSTNRIDDLFVMSKHRYEELLEYGYPKEKAYLQLLAYTLSYCGKAKADSRYYREALNIVEEGSSVHLSGRTMIKMHLYCTNRSMYRAVYKVVMFAKGIF